MTPDEQAVWAYAVTRSSGSGDLARDLRGLTGVDGEPVRMVHQGDLAAIVGSVDGEVFAAQALHRNFEDLDWLAGTARAHDAVVSAVARHGAMVPLRLATIFRDDERVRDMLADRWPDFDFALLQVTGRTEWGVKAYGDRAVLAGPAEPEPAAAGAGTAYLMRRKAQLSADVETERRAVGVAEHIHATLAGVATAARRHRPQDPRLSGRCEWMLLNGAYLVDDDRTDDFADVVAAQDGAHRGIRLELTGPWPPYSFAATEADG
ncbi:GvpL/GvpF family gas vesicle protein [Pseudonocardia sp. DSM 110487]|uniref:GvpL/GvpF family gas vesicle protein n=1 Tax=Pseudonocardia sp. DSM 110487 TaxID=2865833 RepID=UPI001C6A05A4|nr:GvpL/GvpF family gas vesicle protein [Pseudonocardia sp. DSM 110487]QYN38094.1 GvpL/GvpF family gas vesicle protein [Pseudonocardia sp. DSM 110487]